MKIDNVLLVLRGLCAEEWEGDLVLAKKRIELIMRQQEDKELDVAADLTDKEKGMNNILATKAYRDRTECSLKQAYHKVQQYFREKGKGQEK